MTIPVWNPRVLIRTAAMTDEIQSIVNWLSGRQPPRILSGSREKKIINLNKVGGGRNL